jgi:uncharacterized protein YjlB
MSYRAAKVAVIVLSALIILALVGLVAGVAMKIAGRSVHLFGGTGGAAAPASSDGTFALPQGAKILSIETQSDRLVLHIQSPAGDEVDIVSTDDGHLVARIVAPARR